MSRTMDPYMCYYYRGMKRLLKDLEDTNKRYPEFPTKNKILKIYHKVTKIFEKTSTIEDLHSFVENVIFKLALDIHDKAKIDNLAYGGAHLTNRQLMLAWVPILVSLSRLYKCKYKGREEYLCLISLGANGCDKIFNRFWRINRESLLKNGIYSETVVFKDWWNDYLCYAHALINMEKNIGDIACLEYRDSQNHRETR